jgi:hypothetical protein
MQLQTKCTYLLALNLALLASARAQTKEEKRADEICARHATYTPELCRRIASDKKLDQQEKRIWQYCRHHKRDELVCLDPQEKLARDRQRAADLCNRYPWWTPNICKAVASKQVLTGFDATMVTEAVGKPSHVTRTQFNDGQTEEIWTTGKVQDRYFVECLWIFFKNNFVTSIHDLGNCR